MSVHRLIPVNVSSISFVFASLALLFAVGFLQAIAITPAAGSIPGSPDSILIAELLPAYATTQANGIPIHTATINFTVQGRVLNASNTANEFLPGSVNVTATVESTNRSFSQVTGATGFNFNMTLPTQESVNNNTAGYRIYVTTNTTNPAHNKTFNLYRSNATNVTIAFINSFPPFATGVNFTVNVSYFNGTNAVANAKPELRVFKLNGVQQAWTITNLSDTTNAQGVLQFNVTIPSDASGQFALVTDRGAGFLVFGISSAISVAFRTETPTGARRSEFTTSNPVNLVAAIRHSNGTPYTLLESDTAFALVTLPNRSLVNVSLAAFNLTSSPGIMNASFTQTGLTGVYNVRLVVTVQGTVYESQGTFTVNPMRATLQAGAGFFREFGGRSIILPNSTVEFSILAVNNSDDALIQGSVNGGLNVINCSRGNLTFAGFTNTLNGLNATNFSQLQAGQPQFAQVAFTPTVNVCTMRINVPLATGVYRLDVNVTSPVSMNSQVVTASALVRVETIMLNIQPIQASGGFDGGEFSFQLPPGENASFRLNAFNFSSNAQFNSNNIQNVTVLSISPMTFSGGIVNPFNNFTENGTKTCRPCGARPNPALPFFVSYPNTQDARVQVTLPNTTGFFKVAIEANVSGEFVAGEAFFEMKTVNGFASPGSGAPSGQGGGPSFGFGQASCARGNLSFSANVFDVKTNQQAQGVRINSNLLMGMEESTGRNIANLVSVPLGNTTGANGQATFNVSISQNLSSGFYFLLFNVSYQGRDDSIFGMLNCQDQGSRLVISQPPFGQYRPDANLSLNYSQMFTISSNGSFQQITNGTLIVTRLRGFNHDVGGEILLSPNVSQGLQQTNISSGNALITLSPSNFSLTEWPQGFLMMEVNITNGSNPGPSFNQGPSFTVGGGHDSFAGGVQIRAYELFIAQNPPQNGIALGSNMSVLLNASTNVSESGANFTVNFQRFGHGASTPALIRSATRMVDGWNSTANTAGFEQWNVTFAVPVTLQTGEVLLEFTSNNSQGLQSKAHLFTFISGFTVQTLAQDDLFMEGANCQAFDESTGNGSFQGCFNPFAGYTFNYENGTHMNLSRLNTTYSIASRSNSVCLKRAFNFTVGGQGPMGTPTVFDRGSIMAVIDNTTAGVYDTLVVNTSNGTQQIIFATNFTAQNRRFNGNTTLPYRDFYLTNIFQCAHLALANGTKLPPQSGQQGFGGQGGEQSSGDNFVNDVFYVPYRIQYQNAAVIANVTHAGYAIKTGDGRPAGELASNLHATAGSETDSNGFALVRVNITQSNRYQALWDVNTTVGGQNVSDRAKTRGDTSQFGGGQGTRIDVVAFRACRTMATVPALTVGNENASFLCTVRDKSFNAILGANLSVNLISGGFFSKTITAAKLFNATTGATVNLLNSAGTDVNVLFTHPTGWPCNEGFRLEANVTNGTTTQLFDVGYAYRTCGFSGGP